MNTQVPFPRGVRFDGYEPNDDIFNSRQMVSYISRHLTLKPGDIIFTGTPEGVIQGKPPEKRVWLKAGDKVACSVERLGELTFDLT